MQADSVIPDMNNSQSLNRFAYVYNNPLSYNDPTGNVPSAAQRGRNAIRRARGRAKPGDIKAVQIAGAVKAYGQFAQGLQQAQGNTREMQLAGDGPKGSHAASFENNAGRADSAEDEACTAPEGGCGNSASIREKRNKLLAHEFSEEVIVTPEQEQALIENKGRLLEIAKGANERGAVLVGSDLIENPVAYSDSGCAVLCPVEGAEVQFHAHIEMLNDEYTTAARELPGPLDLGPLVINRKDIGQARFEKTFEFQNQAHIF